jgi:transposase
VNLEPRSRRFGNSLYRKESRVSLKERLLLVLKVEGDDAMISARVAKKLRRSRVWTSDWLARYPKEGTDGPENRSESGRPSKQLEEVAVKIRKKLKGWKHG